MSGGRLGLMGALNRASVIGDASAGSQTNSAIQASMERELKDLQKQNGNLRSQLEESRSTLDMLLKQSCHENLDERRVNLLKCQLIQQERQMMLMSEALSSRSSVLMEVENGLSWLADKFRSYIAMEVKAADVPVARSDLMKMVETAESARIKLFKSVENSSREKLAKPLMMVNPFIRPDRQDEHTLFDVMSGKMDYLNLRHVSQLESKLSQLYKELIRLHSLMSDKKTSAANCSGHMTAASRDRLTTQMLTACAMMKESTDSLLTLSLLFPTAPWPALKRPVIKDVMIDDVISSLPSLPRSKSQEVARVVEAALKTSNYRYYMLDREVRALREEVKFHQAVYNVQLEYTQSLFQAVGDGYSKFEKSASDVIVKPLRDVLNNYSRLKTTTSEDALRDFLSSFKDREPQFLEAIEKLSCDSSEASEEKNEALTAFGQEFIEDVDKVVAMRQRKRDQECHEKQEVKLEQAKLDEELRTLLMNIESEKKTPEVVGSIKEESSENVQDNDSSNLRLNRPRTLQATSPNIKSNMVSESKHENVQTSLRKSSSNLESLSDRSKDSTKEVKLSSPVKTKDKSKYLTSDPPGVGSRSESKPSYKPSYKPKLYVANKTLLLRRSGSLTRLSDSSNQDNNVKNISLQTIDKCNSSLPVRRKSDMTFQKPPFK